MSSIRNTATRADLMADAGSSSCSRNPNHQNNGKKVLIDPAIDAKYRAMIVECTHCRSNRYTRFRYFNNKTAMLNRAAGAPNVEPQARFACKSPECLAKNPGKSEVEFSLNGKTRGPYKKASTTTCTTNTKRKSSLAPPADHNNKRARLPSKNQHGKEQEMVYDGQNNDYHYAHGSAGGTDAYGHASFLLPQHASCFSTAPPTAAAVPDASVNCSSYNYPPYNLQFNQAKQRHVNVVVGIPVHMTADAYTYPGHPVVANPSFNNHSNNCYRSSCFMEPAVTADPGQFPPHDATPPCSISCDHHSNTTAFDNVPTEKEVATTFNYKEQPLQHKQQPEFQEVNIINNVEAEGVADVLNDFSDMLEGPEEYITNKEFEFGEEEILPKMQELEGVISDNNDEAVDDKFKAFCHSEMLEETIIDGKEDDVPAEFEATNDTQSYQCGQQLQQQHTYSLEAVVDDIHVFDDFSDMLEEYISKESGEEQIMLQQEFEEFQGAINNNIKEAVYDDFNAFLEDDVPATNADAATEPYQYCGQSQQQHTDYSLDAHFDLAHLLKLVDPYHEKEHAYLRMGMRMLEAEAY